VSRDWRLYLEDMIDCCQKIIEYTSSLDMAVFKDNSLVYDATLRNLEILGEAAKNIPEDIRGRYPQVEWRKVSGLRDVLTHFYFGLEDETLWDVVHHKVPQLLPVLKGIQDENR